MNASNDTNTKQQVDETQPRQKKKVRTGIILSKQTIDTILRQKHRHIGDMIALLTFYHYTALWQGTNQPKASTRFTAKGLHWGPDKVCEIHELLRDLDLIEQVCVTDPRTHKIKGWYVRLPYFQPTDFPESKSHIRVLPHLAKSEQNALRADNTNAFRSGKTHLKMKTQVVSQPVSLVSEDCLSEY